jgi:GrpB-like predicted nucleotidyltransferase (UPF0157 family)
MYPRIDIVPYNAEWPNWFELIKAKLERCLGSLALSIDHIGSTSVPGLGSKNRIDVQVSVSEISGTIQDPLDQCLIAAGFSKSKFAMDHRPPGDSSADENWQKLFLTGSNLDPRFDFNVHIRAKNNKNHQYALVFRDYLRRHPHVAIAYQQLKEKLAKYHPESIEAYVDIKDAACDIILSAAADWSKKVRSGPIR